MQTTKEPIELWQNIYYYKIKNTKNSLIHKYVSNCIYSNKQIAKANSTKDWEEQKIGNGYELYTTIVRLITWKE